MREKAERDMNAKLDRETERDVFNGCGEKE